MAALRIALVAPPFQPVPPPKYGGVERVVDVLARGLARHGHDVVLFASGDSTCPVPIRATVPRALWPINSPVDDIEAQVRVCRQVLDEPDDFDIVHAHLDPRVLSALRPVAGRLVATIHLPVDWPGRQEAILEAGAAAIVALSRSQAELGPRVPWARIIPNALPVGPRPTPRPTADLCFVGRLDPEKGPLEAIEIARRAGRRLRIGARAGGLPEQRAWVRERFMPATHAAHVEYLGELTDSERDALFASSAATLMPFRWPEPFGLVAIESLAVGTPVLATHVGALPEIVRDGLDGFVRRDIDELATCVPAAEGLDRTRIRADAERRFSAEGMVEAYESVYRSVIDRAGVAPARRPSGMASAGPPRRRRRTDIVIRVRG